MTKSEKTIKKIGNIGPLMRGSLIKYNLKCGKKGCRCTQGTLHTAYYFSRRVGGKTKMYHIAKNQVQAVRKYRKNYDRLLSLIDQLTTQLLDELRAAKKK